MNEEYKKLFTPGKIGRITLKNRIVMGPMGILGMCELDGSIGPRGVDYYEERAKGGVGLIITGLCFTTSKFEPLSTEDKYFPLLKCDSLMSIHRINECVERVHAYDTKFCLQLTAGFGRVFPLALGRPGAKPIGVSEMPSFWNPNLILRELSTQDVEELVKTFSTSAVLAKRAGVDAIELHAHEGYIFDQFATALWNKRKDKYGGATIFERMTFILEVINAIKNVAPDMTIIYRYNLQQKIEGGRSEEEGLEMAKILEKAGVDALDVDYGCYDNWYWSHPPIYQPPACMLEAAEKVKKVVNIPVMCVGKMYYPDIAERALEDGKADFVIMSRGLLADPEWANKVREGRKDDIRPCIGCHEGCLGRGLSGRAVSCAVNPASGNEKTMKLNPAEIKKKVMIIGGGIAGMEAARVATLRGHDVKLFEKSDKLGGELIPASVAGFKQDVKLLKQYYETQMKKMKINIAFNTEVTSELIENEKPDVVLIATGARRTMPTLKGSDNSKVLNALDVFVGKVQVGENVIVVRSGLVASELAVYLSQQGKKVSMVEPSSSILPDMFHANREMLIDMLKENNVTIHTNTAVEEITDKGAIVVDKDGEKRELEVDSVVFATSLKPNSALYDEIWDKVPTVSCIGNCAKPGRIMDAIWDAYGHAKNI